MMCLIIAEKLHIDFDIPWKQWSVPKLIVNFGYYQNLEAHKAWAEWDSMKENKNRGKEPTYMVVEFQTPEEYARLMNMENITSSDDDFDDMNERLAEFYGR